MPCGSGHGVRVMSNREGIRGYQTLGLSTIGVLAAQAAHAQQSVFDSGINAFVTWAFAFATPVAVLIVMGLGVAALVGKLSWLWVIGGLVGIGIVFGAEQIVGWIRSLFGV